MKIIIAQTRKGRNMSKPIIAEVLFVDPFRHTEELIFRGPLVEAYRQWRKYRRQRPFAGEFTMLRYEKPDGTVGIWSAEGRYYES